jgi:hypothetical protein
MIKSLQLVTILFVAVAMSAAWAHLLELPNKMALSREDYLVVQQIYGGWALLGIVVIGALILTTALALALRGRGRPFFFALAAAVCVALSLAIFFTFTFPANQATQNWTVLPAEWESLRRRWEYSHAAGAILYFAALASLVLCILTSRSEPGSAATGADR